MSSTDLTPFNLGSMHAGCRGPVVDYLESAYFYVDNVVNSHKPKLESLRC